MGNSGDSERDSGELRRPRGDSGGTQGTRDMLSLGPTTDSDQLRELELWRQRYVKGGSPSVLSRRSMKYSREDDLSSASGVYSVALDCVIDRVARRTSS